ncbi:tetratricopeptide repeat protein [Emticicia sp. 21SJ11W-3]|uniref:type IX secretion system periplasmic lipoprotein PorW/SprE n=1 Tax=Emticicia sp. 21SJ11W-3 TaxID=2916755 RepID=UPI0020A09279|nr:tetratricopeptide repeat protein [Emticicia sp. 21SJ11W-3]UTA68905.1 tetratricopeptide repeat protein [Emticicia sp. 21SJ11W-3]
MQKLSIFILLLAITIGCSQFSQSPTSKAWHNLNARFNSLIIARENMKEAEKALFTTREENYSALIPILLPIDSVKSQAVATNLKEVIEKTSMIAERHSNSKYLAEAYVLLGRARLMKGDFVNAIEVFKYVNSTTKDETGRQSALIWLMRAYIEQRDFVTALKVSEVVRNLDLTKANTRDYYLTKAYLHQYTGELATAAAIAEEALKLMTKNEQTARVHYAVGQMYDLIGQKAKALPHYAAVAKNRPNYDMEFYAGMNALLDEAVARRGTTAGVQENFKKMLVDRKNADLKDKIYFTMGNLEVQKMNYPKAIEYYNASIKNSKGNSAQNAYTYLELAELHYNQLLKYELASLYYDSTLTLLPKNTPDYERITRRASSLTSFVTYQKVVALEDSLQRLAAMSAADLDKALERSIAQKEEEARKAKELADQQALKNANAAVDRLSDRDQTFKRWMLYDPIAINRNKSDFQQLWGPRVLEDNWRRRDKEAGAISFGIERGTVGNQPTGSSATGASKVLQQQTADIAGKALAAKKQELYAGLPNTPEKLAASKLKQEEAYYQLGKIYKFQFNEPDNAITTFKTLLEKFPATVHEAEVLYLLSLSADNQENNPYRSALLIKYPASTYARQLIRGNVNITEDTESKANLVYSQAFNLYSNESYLSALKMAEDGLITYTGTSIEDKFAMLRILLLAKTEQKELYQQALNEFIQGYPSSNLMPKAKELMAVLSKK